MIKFLLFLFFLVSCTSKIENPKDFKTWGYQLQNYTPEKIKNIQTSKNTLWVVDFSILDSLGKDGLKKLRKNNNFFLCYMSIGESEKYRFYWDYLDKKLIHKKNDLWGSYVMKFWEEDWQKFFLKDGDYGKGYLNRIIEAGFDGVYLDIVDGYFHFKDKKTKADLMVDFVVKIKKYTSQKKKNFWVFPQNATSIIDFSKKTDEYFSHIDGVGLESVFYRGDSYENNSFNPDPWALKHIEVFRSKNIPLFNIEYIIESEDIEKYNKVAREKGVIPLVSDRKLTGKVKLLK